MQVQFFLMKHLSASKLGYYRNIQNVTSNAYIQNSYDSATKGISEESKT